MKMIHSIIQDHLNDIRDERKISNVQRESYNFFQLNESENIRKNTLRFKLPIDDAFLKRIYKDIFHNKYTGRRIGKELLHSKNNTTKESDDRWATFEDLKHLNDVCTKWCSRKYFPDSFFRINMIINMIRVYDRLRDISGLDFDIIFKGGVMVRLIILEFLNDFPLVSKLALIDYLNKVNALSMSDLDFEIVNRNHYAENSSINKLILMNFGVLLWIQRIMEKEIKKKKNGLLNTDWDEFESMKELKKELQDEVNSHDANSPFYMSTIDHIFIGDDIEFPPSGYKTKNGSSTPTCRKNKIITDCYDGEKCVTNASEVFNKMGIHNIPTESGGKRLYTTLNTYIGEKETPKRSESLKGVFHLSRIKHAFVVFYTTRDGRKCCDRLSGEMVDLSQAHSVFLDFKSKKLYETVASPYKEYPILGIQGKLRSYSVEGFLFDHMVMIHNKDENPWNVPKKEKRLIRYVCFFLAHFLSQEFNDTLASKYKALNQLLYHIHNSLQTPLKTEFRMINEFAEQEKMSLQHASSKERDDYLKIMYNFLSIFLKQSTTYASSPQKILNHNHLELLSFLLY
jgi:hypothetical protein